MKERRIYIGLKECQQAVSCKDQLEAFAFALLVKLTFVDSCIRETGWREMSQHLSLGNLRIKRALKNAIKYGYIIHEDSCYRALCLKSKGDFNIRMKFKLGFFSKCKNEKTPYRLSILIKEIKIAVLKNHIRKMMSFHDTALMVEASSDSKQIKKGKARLKRMCGKSHFSEEEIKKSTRLSLTRIMKVIGSKRSTTKKLVKELRESGQIIREFESIILEGMDCEAVRTNDYNRARAVLHANNLGGWLYGSCGKVYVQVANRYSLPESEMGAFIYSRNQKCRK